MDLLGDRRCFSSGGNFPVVTPLAKVNDIRVVRVLQNADEHPLAQRFTVPAKQITRLATNVAREHRSVRATSQNLDGPTHEIERLLPREALTSHANAIARDVGGWSFSRRNSCCVRALFSGAWLPLPVAPTSAPPAASPLLPCASA